MEAPRSGHDDISTVKRGLRCCQRAIAAAVLLTGPLAGAVAAETSNGASHTGNPSSVASHIPNLPDQGLLPVGIIERQDIERSGIRYLRELLGDRQALNAFGLRRPFFLGTGYTLILVNGRRLTRSILGSDHYKLFPVSAIERIEILGPGAASVHGGDALAGAINIVTRRDFQGIETQLHASRPTAAGGDAEQARGIMQQNPQVASRLPPKLPFLA